MAIRTRHYEVQPQGSNIILRNVPGFDGEIAKMLNRRGAIIREIGWVSTETDTIAALFSGEGNPSTLVTIDTLGKGTYTNCFLETCRLTGRTRGDGTKAVHVEYERVYRQIVKGSLS